MTYTALKSLILDAQECDTFEQFLAECGGAYPDGSAYDDGTVTEKLEIIYNLRDEISIKDVFSISGMKISEFSREYDIPRRTIDNWISSGKDSHEPPKYLTLLILSDILSNS